MMMLDTELIAALGAAERVVILTGAGVSAESGVPTVRESQTGAWREYDPKDLATPQGFARNSRLVWEWYAWRRQLMQKARPNLAHYGLVDLEQHIPQFLLITQNIDGLHWAAGSRDMIELHGNIARTRCADDGIAVDSWEDTGEVPPRCPHCGGALRPDVVWFGEGIASQVLDQAAAAIQSCDLFICLGTPAVVAPAATFPLLAKRHGAKVVDINPQPSASSVVADWTVRGRCVDAIPALIRALAIPAYALQAAEDNL